MEPESSIYRVISGEGVDALIWLLDLVCLAVVGIKFGRFEVKANYLFPKGWIVA